MNAFGDRLRDARQAQARRAVDARADESLRSSIASRRRLRIGGVAAASAAALLTVGAAGIGFTGLGEAPEPSPSPTVDLGIDDGDVAYATVPLPDEPAWAGSWEEFSQYCGRPAPEDTQDGQGFTSDYTVPEHIELDPWSGTTSVSSEASIALAHRDHEGLPAFVEGPFPLFLRDGLVVGFAGPGEGSIVTAFEEGRTTTQRWSPLTSISACDQTAEHGLLEPGDYDVVLVTRVHNDEASAALHSLRMEGFTLPAASELAAFREGSFECDREHSWYGQTPLTCEPFALPGVEIHEDEQAVTVPYDASYYRRDVDLTFTSSMFGVTLTEPSTEMFWEPPDLPEYEPGTVPVCGETYASGFGTTLLAGLGGAAWDPMFATGETSALSDLEPGDQLEAAVWVTDQGWSRAQLSLPDSARIWIMRQRDIEYDDGDGQDNTTAYYVGEQVIGWADVTSEQDGGAVEIDRYDGPAPWPLDVQDVQRCEGFESTGDGVSMGLIVSPGTLSLDDGRSIEYDGIALRD